MTKKPTTRERLLEAYRLLENVTPLPYDCGRLCGARCCKPSPDERVELGMWLLPHEKELLEDCEGYVFRVSEDGTETLTCSGVCDRKKRPFACRIYPYYPSIKEENGRYRISILRDPRAALSCPLVSSGSHMRSSVFFARAASRAVRVLLGDGELREELLKSAEFLDEIETLRRRFFSR